MDYKSTLNLPQTQFSMKANLAILEPKILSFWQKLDIYHKLREARKGRKKFILHDGPPYANGLIHIGHALNKILKDIILKYKIMSGFDCPFIVGWDCHGLPVEHQLFKELNLTKHDIEVGVFRKKAADFALKYVQLQKDDFKRLGVFSDWDNFYLTLHQEYEYGVIKLLENLVEEGYIYRARLPVNWCGSCETALAEAEAEYLDKESDSVYFLFPLKSSFAGFKNKENKEIYFLVWTTTPWTLISNVAVALHPEFDYCLAEFKDKLVVIGRDLISSLKEKFREEFRVIESFRGVELEHLKLQHPFLNRESSVVLADFVSREEGSGCVHIAPGHGQEDFSLTKKYPLEVIMPVNDKGVFESPFEFRGKDISSANAAVLEKLKENNFLIKHHKIVHSYPHCWRCKNPIIFRATFQWFLNIDHKNLREKLLKEIERVRWVPAQGKERMRAMLTMRPDWCLSRQRLWGVPIPAVKCKTCGEVILDKEVISKTASIFRKRGSDFWFAPLEKATGEVEQSSLTGFTSNLKEFLPWGFYCPNCRGGDFLKEADIMDVWYESGASFFSLVKNHPQLEFPADMYLEGSDQHRGWFQVSLIPSVASQGRAPFKIILTHGFVVDEEGRKMSKSLGNVIIPQKIIKEYGAEILRLWVASSDYSQDVKISTKILRQLADIYRKIRNTIRFILGNLYDFSYNGDSLDYQNLREVDKFMLSKIMCVLLETLSCYESFSLHKIVQGVFNFCNIDLSSFYLDILKDRLYTFSPSSPERRSAQFALYHILKIILKIIAPILPFTAEEVYCSWGKTGEESIFTSTFDDFNPSWIDKNLMQRWEKILFLRNEVLEEIERRREEGVLGSSLEAQVTLQFKGEDFNFYKSYEETLREVFIVSRVTVEKGEPQIRAEKARGKKCLRCWNWRENLAEDPQYSGVCSRCLEVLKGGKL